MRVSLSVGCRPGVQEGADNRNIAVELLTPDAVAGARDMGNLELRHLLLHRGGHLRPNDSATVKVYLMYLGVPASTAREAPIKPDANMQLPLIMERPNAKWSGRSS
jgi:hypothetical protein